MANDFKGGVQRATSWSILISVLMIAAGVLAIVLPMIAGFAVTAVAGWFLLFSGVLHLVMAWRGDHASAILWEILLGLIYGAIGFYLIMRPGVGLASLTLVIATYLFAEAVLELGLSFWLRHGRGAGWLLFDGIVTLFLAVMIWATWPSSAAWVVGTLVGISMLSSGISRLMLSLAVRRFLA